MYVYVKKKKKITKLEKNNFLGLLNKNLMRLISLKS